MTFAIAQTIQSGCVGQPGMLRVAVPVADCTLLMAVGFGGAAGMPPYDAHVPTQITFAAPAANFVTASRKVTSVPFDVHAQQVAPPNAVGTPPSTTRT